MWLDPLVERKYLKNINLTTNVVNVRMELLKEKRAIENKQVGYLLYTCKLEVIICDCLMVKKVVIN